MNKNTPYVRVPKESTLLVSIGGWKRITHMTCVPLLPLYG